ncbi:MAG TPA: hypothetical protein PLI05_05960 [Methanotrichaceae archaeon]|nr:hypothetical protein [Methanotrichaceae archaeon]HQI91228.1 hypothetical protein [Methanotrichaceae archaeon]HQJ61724.1 hypothetical protein [Methanothrix soehngenii]
MEEIDILKRILCECGDFIDCCTFKDYISTPINPSTPTIGHKDCGLIFDFIEGKVPKRYSSKKELKTLAMKFAEKRLDIDLQGIFLLEVDRLKSESNMPDAELLMTALKEVMEKKRTKI